VGEKYVAKKKILMVHNFYQIGGGEHTVFKNEVDMLRKHGHIVIEYTRSNDELKESRLKMLLLPFSTLWSFKTYKEVKKIIKQNCIDIVHCHNTFPLISPSVYYAARTKKIPVIQTIHNFRLLCPAGVFF
jgi:glycosyltransferase involved in cell wall biosynthesis